MMTKWEEFSNIQKLLFETIVVVAFLNFQSSIYRFFKPIYAYKMRRITWYVFYKKPANPAIIQMKASSMVFPIGNFHVVFVY